MDKKRKLSSDSEGLGYWGNANFVVGHVSEVNGTEASEIPEFVPTKHELIQLAKYWIGRSLDNDFFYFTYAQTGSSEWRTNKYADRRIDRAAEILSEDEMKQLIAEAEKDFKEKYGISDEDWNIFKNGSKEEWQAHQDKVQQEIMTQLSETDSPRKLEAETEDESAIPFLDQNGEVVIPHNCPKKYRWWDDGQSIEETRAELLRHLDKLDRK